MSLNDPGDVLHPRFCRVSASPDKTKLAFTFSCEGRMPVTIVLPFEGAIGLQRQLAQSLYLLGARPAAGQGTPATEQAAAG